MQSLVERKRRELGARVSGDVLYRLKYRWQAGGSGHPQVRECSTVKNGAESEYLIHKRDSCT